MRDHRHIARVAHPAEGIAHDAVVGRRDRQRRPAPSTAKRRLNAAKRRARAAVRPLSVSHASEQRRRNVPAGQQPLDRVRHCRERSTRTAACRTLRVVARAARPESWRGPSMPPTAGRGYGTAARLDTADPHLCRPLSTCGVGRRITLPVPRSDGSPGVHGLSRQAVGTLARLPSAYAVLRTYLSG